MNDRIFNQFDSIFCTKNEFNTWNTLIKNFRIMISGLKISCIVKISMVPHLKYCKNYEAHYYRRQGILALSLMKSLETLSITIKFTIAMKNLVSLASLLNKM